MGNGQGVGSGKSRHRDLVFESPADRSGPVLMIASATGGQFGSARLDRVLPDGGSRTLVTLKDVMVASVSSSSYRGTLGFSFSLTMADYEIAGGFSDSSIQSR